MTYEGQVAELLRLYTPSQRYEAFERVAKAGDAWTAVGRRHLMGVNMSLALFGPVGRISVDS